MDLRRCGAGNDLEEECKTERQVALHWNAVIDSEEGSPYHHFGASAIASFDLLKKRATSIDVLDTTYFDSSELLLLHHNMYLHRTNREWVLKHLLDSTSGGISCKRVTGEDAILEYLRRTTFKGSKEEVSNLESLCPNVIASFKTTLVWWQQTKKKHIYVDVAMFASNDFYVLGTIVFRNGGAEDLLSDADSDIIDLRKCREGPVQSKLFEYLRCYQPEIFKAAVELRLVPDCTYADSHMTSDPIGFFKLHPNDAPILEGFEATYFQDAIPKEEHHHAQEYEQDCNEWRQDVNKNVKAMFSAWQLFNEDLRSFITGSPTDIDKYQVVLDDF
ncbi:hypothetical protein QOT17_012865 [Balamuthia mandrillaris]